MKSLINVWVRRNDDIRISFTEKYQELDSYSQFLVIDRLYDVIKAEYKRVAKQHLDGN